MPYYVYIVQCGDGSLYTGYTTDVERRINEHNEGIGAKYTRGRTPVELMHVESYPDLSAAMAREHEIKGLRVEEKWALIEDEGRGGSS